MTKYGCSGCDSTFNDFSVALAHHNQIDNHNIYSIKPCPSCASLRAEVREKDRFTIRDKDGKIVSQGAFNGLEAHYYEFLAIISRIEVEGMEDYLQGLSPGCSYDFAWIARGVVAYLKGVKP